MEPQITKTNNQPYENRKSLPLESDPDPSLPSGTYALQINHVATDNLNSNHI